MAGFEKVVRRITSKWDGKGSVQSSNEQQQYNRLIAQGHQALCLSLRAYWLACSTPSRAHLLPTM